MRSAGKINPKAKLGYGPNHNINKPINNAE
jgi:hypothetical protein